MSLLNESVVKDLDLRHDFMRDNRHMVLFGGTRIDQIVGTPMTLTWAACMPTK